MTKKKKDELHTFMVRLGAVVTYRPVLVKAKNAMDAFNYVDDQVYALDKDSEMSDFDNSEVVEITDDHMRDTYARDAEDWTEDDIYEGDDDAES